MEFVDPGGAARDLLVRARGGGIVLDYAIVSSEEDLGDSEVLRRAVVFTVRGFCQVRGLTWDSEIDPSRVSHSLWTISTVGHSIEEGVAC